MLLTEHRGHYLAALPLVLLATCVIAHVLMHRHAVPGDGSKANPPYPGERNEPRCARLWALAARPRELGGLHHVRLQLLQTADLARLENLQDIRSVHCCLVRRDVRLSADAVRAVRLASDQVSQSGLAVAQQRPSLVDPAGRERRPHFSPLHIASYIFIGAASGFCRAPGRCSTTRNGTPNLP